MPVGQGEPHDFLRALRREHLRRHRKQPAVGRMFLRRRHKAHPLRRLQNDLLIERLDAVGIDNARRNVLLFEQLRRMQAGRNEFAAGNEQHVLPLFQHLCAARENGVFGIEIFARTARNADVGRLFVLEQFLDDGFRLEAVGRKIHAHPGQSRHCRNILQRVVRHAERPVGNAPRNADERDVGLRISDVHLRLFIGAGGEEAGGRHGEHLLPARRKPRRNGDEILLRNAHFHALGRELLKKGGHGARPARIGAGDDDIPIFLCRRKQRIADDLAVGHFIHTSPPIRAPRARTVRRSSRRDATSRCSP